MKINKGNKKSSGRSNHMTREEPTWRAIGREGDSHQELGRRFNGRLKRFADVR